MTDTPEQDESKTPVKEMVVDIAMTEFVGGRDSMNQTYLVNLKGPNVAIYGNNARAALSAKFWDVHGRIPAKNAVIEAWDVISTSTGDMPKKELPLRVGSVDRHPVIDLGDGRAVVVTPTGWEVVDRSPVTFTQTNLTMTIPEPVRGGNVDRIFEVVNVEPSQRLMFLGWLVAALFDDIAHPIIVLRGEQGAAKSTTAKTIALLLDPTTTGTVAPPKDEERWTTSCMGHWIVSVDNVSKVPEWWSDSLCRTVTGDGREARKLYTDADVHAVKFRRCVIVNGITLEGMKRPDLLERSMAFDLKRPSHRLTEREVTSIVDEIRPEVLGGLLDLAVKIMGANIDRPDNLPRMADFGLIIHKLDAIVDGNDAPASTAYAHQLDELFEEAWEDDVVSQMVLAAVCAQSSRWWEVQTEDLLKAVNDALEQDNRPRDTIRWWPSTPAQLGTAIIRSAGLLRQHGLQCESKRVRSGGKQLRGWKFDYQPPDGESD